MAALQHEARILVVDDDPRIRQMLTRYFEDEGYTVSSAADGNEMRSRLRQQSFDAILLDLVLPGGTDGLDLAREIRATSDVPIMMLTGRDDVVVPASAVGHIGHGPREHAAPRPAGRGPAALDDARRSRTHHHAHDVALDERTEAAHPHEQVTTRTSPVSPNNRTTVPTSSPATPVNRATNGVAGRR